MQRLSCPIFSRTGFEVFVRLKSTLIFFLTGLFLLVLIQSAPAQSRNSSCGLSKDLQSEVETKYPGTKVVTLSDLNEDDKQVFQKEQADSCPGLVNVDFYGDGKPTLALALTRGSQANRTTKLVVAHNIGGVWRTSTLETTNGPAPVVWSQGPGEYKGVYQDKLRATKPVIVFCGYSSWAVLYAWTNNKVAKLWLRD